MKVIDLILVTARVAFDTINVEESPNTLGIVYTQFHFPTEDPDRNEVWESRPMAWDMVYAHLQIRTHAVVNPILPESRLWDVLNERCFKPCADALKWLKSRHKDSSVQDVWDDLTRQKMNPLWKLYVLQECGLLDPDNYAKDDELLSRCDPYGLRNSHDEFLEQEWEGLDHPDFGTIDNYMEWCGEQIEDLIPDLPAFLRDKQVIDTYDNRKHKS